MIKWNDCKLRAVKFYENIQPESSSKSSRIETSSLILINPSLSTLNNYSTKSNPQIIDSNITTAGFLHEDLHAKRKSDLRRFRCLKAESRFKSSLPASKSQSGCIYTLTVNNYQHKCARMVHLPEMPIKTLRYFLYKETQLYCDVECNFFHNI